MNISEDQKRWLVIGIAFNKLVPQIRSSVEQSLNVEYQRLCSSDNIHGQTPPKILKNHPKHLKYENINNNSNHKLSSGKFDFSKFDYKVASHVDFAKLYLQPFMAKFSAFDGKCDGSAVLLLLGEVPVFSHAIQLSAKTVRDHVRNEWAHCNFTDWDTVKFQSCFQEMQHLVQSLGLPTTDETTLISELSDWETKGTAFCGNSTVDPTLLSLVHEEVRNLDDLIKSQLLDVKQNLEQLMQLPQNVQQVEQELETLKELKHEVETLKQEVVEGKQNLEQLMQLPQKVEQVEQEVQTLKQVADLSRSAIKRQESSNPPSFFGALDRNEYFTGRKKELESLDRAFQEVNTALDGVAGGSYRRKAKVHGISGLGGCGKSSLAFEYAWCNLQRYPGGVFVLNGESDELLRASLQEIHGTFVHKSDSNKPEERKQFDQLMTETLSWLGNQKDKWLLLVDNMDQKELSSYARKVFFGQWKTKTLGDILVTSRRSSQALCEDLELHLENCLELDVFSDDESIDFVKKRIGLPYCSDDQEQGVKELTQELNGLPLALEQAAAYIKALKCSTQSYVKQYRSQKSVLLNRKTAKPCSEIYSEARMAVQSTWLLNFNYIETDERDEGLGKAAAFFMEIATHLAADEIPFEMLNVGAPEIDNEYLKNRLKMPLGAEQIVDLLVRFSLFRRMSDDTLSIHRLVQETLRERCGGKGETGQVISSAIRMLHYAFLHCVGPADFFYDFYARLGGSPTAEMWWNKDRENSFSSSIDEAKLEVPRWKKLSVNSFQLCFNLLTNSTSTPDYLFSEASARLFCETAFYCYSLGLESEGYHLQQLVLDLLSALKEPTCFYKEDELMKVTRIMWPVADPHLLSLKLVEAIHNASDKTDVPVGSNQTKLLERIEMGEPKATEAFSRGDFQTSSDLCTEIVNLSIAVNQPRFRPLGEIFCKRGIANLRMQNFEAAVDDFNGCLYADNEHFRGYYWKVYTLCKLVESGRTEFISRAQAAAAVLHFKFARSKREDIQKLQKTFQNVPGLLHRITKYKFVSHVCQLNELESELSENGNSNSRDSFTIILADGKYDFKKIVILEGCYYFVCLPGSSAVLSCGEGFYLTSGSFLFENVEFESALPSVDDQPLSFVTVGNTIQNEMLCSLTLGRSHRSQTEAARKGKHELSALIEAEGITSLVIDHCVVAYSNRSGIIVKADCHEKMIVSMRSCDITCCKGAGLFLLGGSADCHLSIRDSTIHGNMYGIVLNSPSRFYMEKNDISANLFSGILLSGGCNGGLLKNTLICNVRHGIFFQGSNAQVEENVICKNSGWGIVCCVGSSIACKKTLLANNFCGGLRIMFNGKGTVLVQECEFIKNVGPNVFPVTANEICPLERKLKELSRRPLDFPIIFYLRHFLILGERNVCEFPGEFKCPFLLDNRFSNAPEKPLYLCTRGCSLCRKNVPSECELIECPNCHVARYCSRQCFDIAQAVHSSLCNSILEANKECKPLHRRPLPNHPVKKSHKQEAGISLCVIAAVNVPEVLCNTIDTDGPHKAKYCICLVTCPQGNFYTVLQSPKIHRFIMIHGSHVQESMMDIKAASILANFDSEGETITVYSHRIFPLGKVPDSWKWLNRTLDLFAKRYSKEAGKLLNSCQYIYFL